MALCYIFKSKEYCNVIGKKKLQLLNKAAFFIVKIECYITLVKKGAF